MKVSALHVPCQLTFICQRFVVGALELELAAKEGPFRSWGTDGLLTLSAACQHVVVTPETGQRNKHRTACYMNRSCTCADFTCVLTVL